MTPSLLVITNMGPKPSAPYQGQFVKNQVDALADFDPDYFFMRWNNDSRLNRLFKYPVLWLHFIWQAVLNRRRFDILHVHYFYPTIWLALTYRWLRNPKAKIIVTFHGSDIYLYQPESRWYKWAAAHIDYAIFTSAALKARFFRQNIASEVLPAGIHASFAECAPMDMQQKTYDLLYVGTMDKNKGMDRLQLLLERMPHLKVALVGHGPMRPQLEKLAATQPNIQLFDPVGPEALRDFYQKSRLFLSLSRNESFGLVMTEAMACYTPVVATDTDGARAQLNTVWPRHAKTIQDVMHAATPPENCEVNGFRVSQHDEAQCLLSLQTAIQQLLSLPEQDYRQLQMTGRASAEPFFVTTIADRLRQLYRQ
jgi:glycosyltransferase involved in cell wall biosynthesis